MTASDFKHRLLRLLRFENPGSAPSHVQDDVRDATNQAFQQLWTLPPAERRKAWTRTDEQVTTTPGQRDYILSQNIQTVLGPVYRGNGQPLNPIANKSEALNFQRYFTGGPNDANGTPTHFYLDRKNRPNESDSVEITLQLRPSPAKADTITLEVETEAPHFDTADFCADPAPNLPVPHAYVESLLLPIALHHASRSAWFSRKDETRLGQIEKDYQAALLSAGIVDPQTQNAKKRDESAGEAA